MLACKGFKPGPVWVVILNAAGAANCSGNGFLCTENPLDSDGGLHHDYSFLCFHVRTSWLDWAANSPCSPHVVWKRQ